MDKIITEAEIAQVMNWKSPGAYSARSMKRIKWIVEIVANRMIEAKRNEIETLIGTIHAMQANIDRLMLEYCPGEMTPLQIAEWEASQKPIDIQAEYKREIDRQLGEGSDRAFLASMGVNHAR